MRKLLHTLTFVLLSIWFAHAQSISFTSTLTEAEIGSTVTINYEYTIPADGNIYCAINLYDEFTWQSMVADGVLSPATAGTNVSGSFQFTIPEGTTPTADLTGNLNYKLVIELSDSGWNWLAGDYPATEINLAETLSNTEFNTKTPFTVFPNPSADYLEINGLEDFSNKGITIFNALGKVVFQDENLQSNRLNVSNLNSGTYLMSIQSDSFTQTVKFIKK
jgi:hypothetical protein